MATPSRDEMIEFFESQGLSREDAEQAADNNLRQIENMSIPQKNKLATTAQLKELNDIAIERGYNRAADERLFRDIDPDGTHIATFSMIHDHKAGERCEPHVRVQWMVKLKDEVMERLWADGVRRKGLDPNDEDAKFEDAKFEATVPRVFIDCDAAKYMELEEHRG